MKKIKRILIISALSLGVLLIALVLSVVFFKDKIIAEFIREANKYLNTPVKVGKIDVSIFDNFPQLSIQLNDVYVEDSHPGVYPLLTANKISFQLNPIEVWQGKYNVKGLVISQSETNLKLNRNGVSNYDIIKPMASGETQSSVRFALKNVSLNQTLVKYSDLRSADRHIFRSEKLNASIDIEDVIYRISGTGDVTSEMINIEGTSYLQNKTFLIETNLVYNDEQKGINIEPSVLKMGKASFSITGNYQWKDKSEINLETKGTNTDIQTLISFLPEATAKHLAKYESEGDIYFSSSLRGVISRNRSPSLKISFGFRKATLFHPDYKARIESAEMEGSFAVADLSQLQGATLVLKDVSGQLNGQFFKGNLVINDFKDPSVICNFKGKLDAAEVLNFYPVSALENVSGILDADVSLEGKLDKLKDKSTAQEVKTQGTIDLQKIDLDYGKNKIPVRALNGSLQFNNNDLALSNVTGSLGTSDFVMNGFFKNVITFLLFENQPIGIEADLSSDYINLDEMFTIIFGSDADDEDFKFSINKNVSLNFNCDVQSMNYKRFRGKKIQGDLLIKNQMAVSRNLKLSAMGGTLELSGILDAQNPKAIDVVATARMTDLHIDSAFYIFENFQQDFIQDKHLKGDVTADVVLEMTLQENLRLYPETLIADVGATLRNGQLNNFDPMQKLNKYLDDEGLSKLRFAEIRNDIHIENKTVFIPEMEIKTNLTSLTLSGTHTFDQQIAYRIMTPLRRKKITDPDALEAIEHDPKGGPKLFLKITGTTDDYKIAYDGEAVRKKIATDLKKEVKELKDAFRSKGKQKQKEVELQKDDYFDWD